MIGFAQMVFFAGLHGMFLASPWGAWAPDLTLVVLFSLRNRLGQHLAPRALLAVLLGCWLDAWSAAPWGLQIAIVVGQTVFLFAVGRFLDRGRVGNVVVGLGVAALLRWLLQFGVASTWLYEQYANFWMPAFTAIPLTLLVGLLWSLRLVVNTESNKSLLHRSGS